jgi:hypothetical protein
MVVLAINNISSRCKLAARDWRVSATGIGFDRSRAPGRTIDMGPTNIGYGAYATTIALLICSHPEGQLRSLDTGQRAVDHPGSRYNSAF